MMRLAKHLMAAAAAPLLSGWLFATPAHAASITLDLTSSGVQNGAGNVGNSWTFTDPASGITVVATAWAYTYGSSNNALEKAWLGSYSTGLGVCDVTEGVSCGSPQHQVDNVGPDNFVLFYFSEAVDVTSIRIDPYGEWDRDVSYWTGNLDANEVDLTGINYAGLGPRGLNAYDEDTSDRSDSARSVNIDVGTQYVNAVLFGALIGEPDESKYKDFFKISKIKGYTEPPREVPPVPEPASMLLLGTGLAGLLAKRARRARD